MPTPRRYRPFLLLAGMCLAAICGNADENVFYHGKVTLEDGSPPGHMVLIQRTCVGQEQSTPEGAASGKTGEYFIKLLIDEMGRAETNLDTRIMLQCYLEAADRGFVSSHLDLTDTQMLRNPRLPAMVLTPKSHDSVAYESMTNVPRAASHNWNTAIRQLMARNWTAAEAPLRAVVQTAPNFAAGWSALGTDYSNLGKPDDARTALEQAVTLDPKPLPPYLALARAQIDVRDWKGAAATSQSLSTRDSRHTYVESYFLNAVALYQMGDFDHALTTIHNAIQFDKLHELTRTEYLLGLILEAKGDYENAGTHLRTYVTQHPHADDVAKVNERLANLGKAPPADLASELTSLDMRMVSAGEAPVPGGIAAFSRVAQLKTGLTAADFFLEYCRAISAAGVSSATLTTEAAEEVKSFIATVAVLETLGEPRENGTHVRIAFGNDAEVQKSRAILAALGLKLTPNGDAWSIDPGDQPHDGARQRALAGLGVDEYDLRVAVAQKREFTFEVPRENARLVGGPAWGLVLKGLPDMPGGPAEAFIRDRRFARVYSALGAMDDDSAGAVVSALSLENLIVKYSNEMHNSGEAIAIEEKHVAVPGGVKAQPIWATLAGANPQMPVSFLRALFEKDDGRLLAFYSDLMHADAAHQQYFMESAARAEAFYKWYRDSVPIGAPRPESRWQAKVLQSLWIDGGAIRFPGGREAWSVQAHSDDDAVLHSSSPQALVAVTDLEQKRGQPISAEAAALLARRYADWHNLFPWFGKLPALDAAGFHALAAFTDDAAKAPAAQRNLLMGEWNSLVELTVLGAQAGSLDGAQAAKAFEQACAVRTPAAAMAALRALLPGAGDLDEAIPATLLRLSGARREAFDSVRRLQNVPPLAKVAEADGNAVLAALAGNVYAALLDPSSLLVAEDPQLLSKHNFVPAGDLFASPALNISSTPPGSNFTGGFANFAEAARALRQQTTGEATPTEEAPATAVAQEGPANTPAAPVAEGDPVFHAGGRIVEAYATVVDSRGHYVDNLEAGQFSILEEGQSKPLFAFENHTAGVSVALLFDTTGSMVDALPPLRSAAMRLVDDLRDTDSVAVYSFSDSVNEQQPFTSDKESAKRAILRTHAQGITALYDALVRVNRDLAARGGKKVIIVFTDGSDNASMLTSNTAIERARAGGIPIYTIAEGEAIERPQLMAELNRMSQSTGGTQFLIHKLSDIEPVFEKVSEDLMHGYLLAFQPSPGENHVWRPIGVVLSNGKGMQVRAREGYYIE